MRGTRTSTPVPAASGLFFSRYLSGKSIPWKPFHLVKQMTHSPVYVLKTPDFWEVSVGKAYLRAPSSWPTFLLLQNAF